MKELLTKIKGSKLARRVTGAFVAAQGYATMAFAAPNEDGKSMMINAINLITDYAIYAGALVLVYAIISYIFAFKSQNAEGQTNAITWLVCGAMMVSIKAVLTFIGVLS